MILNEIFKIKTFVHKIHNIRIGLDYLRKTMDIPSLRGHDAFLLKNKKIIEINIYSISLIYE